MGALGLDRGHPLDRLSGVLQGGQVLVDPGRELLLVEVADHDQGGVVGAVVGFVEGAHIVDGGGVQLLDRADARPVIGVGLVGRPRQVEAEETAVGRGQHPLAQLLLHHVALGLEVGVVDDQRAHPLALGPDQPLQMVGRHHLVVVGEVVEGRRVVEAAHVLGQAVEALGRQVAGGLEHHVFEEVREAGAAGRIVLRPHAVPDLHGDVRRRAVERGVDLQPVGQLALLVDDGRHQAALGRRLAGGDGPGLGVMRARRQDGRGQRQRQGDGEDAEDGAGHGRLRKCAAHTLSTGRRRGKLTAWSSGLGPGQLARRTSILPAFWPAIRPIRAPGAAAMPSTMVSWYLTRPSFSQPAMSRRKSG